MAEQCQIEAVITVEMLQFIETETNILDAIF